MDGVTKSSSDHSITNPEPASISALTMTSQWEPHREPLRVTLFRTGTIALVLGALLVHWSGGGLSRWPIATALMLWPSFGGHWVELWFLNWLRPRLSSARVVQVVARVGVWFVGGVGLALGAALTATMLIGLRPSRWPALWLGGLAFIGIELAAHLVLRLRGRPSFYNGLG
jgi:hypothetical protein